MGYGVAKGVIKYRVEIEGVPKEFQPEFDIKLPTNAEYRKYRNETAEAGDDANELVEKVLNRHIIGWKNVYDTVTGEEVEYSKKAIGDLSQKIKGSVFVRITEVTGII